MAEQPTPVLTRRRKTLVRIDRRAWLGYPSEEDIVCKGCRVAAAHKSRALPPRSQRKQYQAFLPRCTAKERLVARRSPWSGHGPPQLLAAKRMRA